MEFQFDPQRICHCLAGGIIHGRPQSAGGQDDIAASQGFTDDGFDALGIISHAGCAVYIHTHVAQAARQEGGVGVLYVSQEKFSTDGDDFSYRHRFYRAGTQFDEV